MTRRGLGIAILMFGERPDECTARSVQSGTYEAGSPLIDPLHALVIVAAGIGAGTINTIVGSGSLITFPTLLLLGYPPLVANVSNTIGLVPGAISGSIGYRRELAGQRAPGDARSLVAAALGGLTGAALLLILPAGRVRPDRAGADPGGLRARRHPAAPVDLGRRPSGSGWATRRTMAAGRCSSSAST